METIELLEIVTKIGLFFLVAYLNGLLVSALSWWMSSRQVGVSDWSPLTHLPLSSGILWPILTTVFFLFPVGFTRHVQRPFLDEIESYPIRFFALFVHLILHFLMLLVIRIYPGILIWSDWLFLYLVVIHLLFIIMNLLPFYPSVTSFLVLSWIQRRMVRKYDLSAAYQVILSYKGFTMVLLILGLFAGLSGGILTKIQIHITQMTSLPVWVLWTVTGIFLMIFLTVAGLYRFHLVRYQAGLKKLFHDLFKEREKENETHD